MASDWKRLVVEVYERSLARHGPTLRATRWANEENQHTRFAVLAEVGPMAGASVADVGSGLGDFFGFLRAQGIEAEYVGYDVTPGMVEAARRKYPEGRFELRDILTEGMGGPFDYAIASGTFNIRMPDHDAVLRRLLEAMYAGCRRAVAVNVLRPPAGFERPLEPLASWVDETFYEVEPAALMESCRPFVDAIELREGYLPGEFTLFLRHAPLP